MPDGYKSTLLQRLLQSLSNLDPSSAFVMHFSRAFDNRAGLEEDPCKGSRKNRCCLPQNLRVLGRNNMDSVITGTWKLHRESWHVSLMEIVNKLGASYIVPTLIKLYKSLNSSLHIVLWPRMVDSVCIAGRHWEDWLEHKLMCQSNVGIA